MTRKDYELIASVFAATRPAIVTDSGEAICKRTETQRQTWEQIVHRMANDLVSTNLRFDSARFKQACGL